MTTTSQANNEIYLTLASPTDVSECMHVMSRAFQHNAPLIDAFYPAHDTADGHAAATTLFTSTLESYKSAPDLVKAVARSADDSKDSIAGFALWTYMTATSNLSPAQLADSAPADPDVRFTHELWAEFVRPRRTVVLEADRQNPGAGVWVLEYLAVDPDFQRHGVGQRLVKWGLERAERERKEALVEATPVGEGCYRKCGFETESWMKFAVGEEFSGRRLPELAFMRKRAA